MNTQWIVRFHDGNAAMRQLLGGKGANLAEMTKAGLPVPPGFTITTDACRAFYAGRTLPGGLMKEVTDALEGVEAQTGRRFGDPQRPLLVSVRSGSVDSMPGMMDTILNLGLNDETVRALADETGNARFAYDCYRRLVQMFGNVVFGVEGVHFETLLHQLKQSVGAASDQQLTAEHWQTLIEQYKAVITRLARTTFPQNVQDQLRLAVEAVFRSWNNQRARIYRSVNRIPDEQGTAVNIQAMVFGNLGDDCGTGVLFTRNPSTGDNVLFGEFLENAQGEDVVAGVRTPRPIDELENAMPEVFAQLTRTARQLEAHYRDMQDIEFTVERGKLYMLQTRVGKRTAQAALKIAADLVAEDTITPDEALLRVEVGHLDQLLHPAIDPEAKLEVLATGLPASPGAASGAAVFDADTAELWAKRGDRVILVRAETTPEDIHGVIAAEGVLTSRGGMTSHAAVVARGMGKCCVCGCEDARVDEASRTAVIGGRVVAEGDIITLDGSTGRVIAGHVPLKDADMTPELMQMLAWADDVRRLRVIANADNPEDAAKAREFGAEGVGLCRTEHMFLSPQRLPVVQAMILAETAEDRLVQLRKLLPMQQADFEGIFRAMDGLPVTIRLLDPPLHEFLPNLEELVGRHLRLTLQQGDADAAERDALAGLIRKVRSLHEANPMLGQRGCRLGIVFPDIYDMQIEAIFRAARVCMLEGVRVLPEIMVPLVGHENELRILRELIDRVAGQVLGADAREVPYKVGTMIEVPRAALTARKIAKHADFFSFGTNDLTQMTFGCSRDDAEGKFLSHYVDNKLLPANPFQVLDGEGVGQLIEWAVAGGRAVKPQLKTGICGEHGGDKESIFFCHSAGLDYVSCSPYRVPLARLAAAQAQLTLGDAADERQERIVS
ncbi:pyruvate, phosphate dikinase [Paenibacillus cymbidii]|uniref:pyruvate, phosphate dikinase n=1 Tax=Paenibacillus cymbidii TaxID=1639034 RepID=UPI00107FEAD4|nr:pyruvate, phosphate dikinase [Paenibacillus cymbidii]